MSAAAGPGGIVYEQFGQIHIYDIAIQKEHAVPIDIAADLSEVRPHFQNVAREIHDARISPTGMRAVFEAHGEIISRPPKRATSQSDQYPGVMERTPRGRRTAGRSPISRTNPANTRCTLKRRAARARPARFLWPANRRSISTPGPHAAAQHEDIRGLINAGHRRGAQAIRCVGEPARMRVEAFPAFCPVALAGIGDLPDTVVDRAIVIPMRRRGPDEPVSAYRERITGPAGRALGERLAAWAARVRERATTHIPEMASGLTQTVPPTSGSRCWPSPTWLVGSGPSGPGEPR